MLEKKIEKRLLTQLRDELKEKLKEHFVSCNGNSSDEIEKKKMAGVSKIYYQLLQEKLLMGVICNELFMEFYQTNEPEKVNPEFINKIDVEFDEKNQKLNILKRK